MIIIKGTNKDIQRLINNKLNGLRDRKDGTSIIFIKRKIGKYTLARIIDVFNPKTIVITKGVVKQMPKRYISALKRLNINVIIKDIKKGRKPIPCDLLSKIEEISAREGLERAIKKAGISRRAYFYLKKRCVKNKP